MIKLHAFLSAVPLLFVLPCLAQANMQVHAEITLPGSSPSGGNAAFEDGETADLLLKGARLKITGSAGPENGAHVSVSVIPEQGKGATSRTFIKWGETAHLVVNQPADCRLSSDEDAPPCRHLYDLVLTVYQGVSRAPKSP